MKNDPDKELIRNKFISYRVENFEGKKIVLLGLPLTHSLFILRDFEIFVWDLCNGKNSLNKVCKKVRDKYGKEYEKPCVLLLESMIRKKILEVTN